MVVVDFFCFLLVGGVVLFFMVEVVIDGFCFLVVGGDKVDLSGDGKDIGVFWIMECFCFLFLLFEFVDLLFFLCFFRVFDELLFCGGFGERLDVFSFRGDIILFVVVCGG